MTELAKQTKKPTSIRGILSSPKMKDQFAKAIPEHIKAETFVRVCLTALTRTPKLMECTQESLFKCMMDLASNGLMPDGRNAHLIPFKNHKTNQIECQLIIDYKGLVELVRRSGEVSNIHCDKVCENDLFEVNAGKLIEHRINYKASRGNPYAYYCIMDMKDGSQKLEVMTKDEVESIRKRSKASGSGPWVSDFDEMAKKTVFRRASKWVSLSPEIRNVIDIDDKQYKNITPKFNIPEVQSENEELALPDLDEKEKETYITTINAQTAKDDLSDFWRSIPADFKADNDVKAAYLAMAEKFMGN
jgi:recombination protein RecT